MQIRLVMGNPAIRRVLQRSQSFGRRSLQLLQPGEVIQPHGEIEVGALVRNLYAVPAILAEARHLHAQGLSNRSEGGHFPHLRQPAHGNRHGLRSQR
jgi:hypothetical protein